MLIYVLFIDFTSRIYALFVAKSTSVLGLGGVKPILQIHRILDVPVIESFPLVFQVTFCF